MSFPKRKLSSSILAKLGSSKLSKNANNPRANKAKYVVAFPLGKPDELYVGFVSYETKVFGGPKIKDANNHDLEDLYLKMFIILIAQFLRLYTL